MKNLIDYISQFGSLNTSQIEMFLAKARVLNLRKDKCFSEPGKVARRFGFLMEGVVRVYDNGSDGEELTKYFIEEHNILVDLNSFDNKIPASVYLQAVTDCEIIFFSKEDWEDLLHTIDGLDNIVNKIISKAMFQKVVRLSALASEDGTTRYLSFLNKYPNLVNRIPLSYVASYLRVTQSSLSRIRKGIR
jgi:CRP-like cAMP-binding protein